MNSYTRASDALPAAFTTRRKLRGWNKLVRLLGGSALLALFFYGVLAEKPWIAAAAIWMLTPMLLFFAVRFPVSLDPIVEPKHCLSARDAMRSREVWLQFVTRNWFAIASLSFTGFVLLHAEWVTWIGAVGFWVFSILAGFLHAKSSVELRRACA
ncbi:hypothetical protein [Phaeobacter inhibens]|uniref:hypothetical protein n=1 Tax=Phaeobacter inhibens TaxID=221822 RepID=UPI000F4A2367|nr:hypothetical protein [Phaeobacter inhibens]